MADLRMEQVAEGKGLAEVQGALSVLIGLREKQAACMTQPLR